MMNAKEIADIWKEVVKIYNDTRGNQSARKNYERNNS